MSDKAQTIGISWKPASLYDEAKRYGESLKPQVNVSVVVCGFVREALIDVGWLKRDGKPRVTAAEVKAITEIRAAGLEPVDVMQLGLAHLDIKTIKSAKRGRTV